MSKKIIRICYRKIIDASSQKAWDKLVFENSYKEFQMQSQFYNQEKKYNSFSELVNKVQGADKLHFLVSASVVGYLKQLNGIVPDILDDLDNHFLKFSNYQFEIIDSDIKNKSLHRVAINFFSNPVIWHDTIGDHLLVSSENEKITEDGTLTHLLKLRSFLSIYSLKEIGS